MPAQIAILSFSPIAIDARVLRQIEYLLPHFSVSVIAYGNNLPAKLKAAPFYPVIQSGGWKYKLRRWSSFVLGRFFPKQAYEYAYWSVEEHRQALEILLQIIKPQVIHANDLLALPVAVHAAEVLQAKVVLDLHEYAPLEDERLLRMVLYRPYMEYLLRQYAPKASSTITVADAIAERYAREFGFHPITILNIPTASPTVDFRSVGDRIRLIHHGTASPTRQPEQMIKALALTDSRFELHFMLIGNPAYQNRLQAQAEQIAPDRVFFHSPVAPTEIVAKLNEYDIGFYLLRTENYNDSVALPNKFFDFVQAGLTICVGPSPEMARLVRKYELGVVADSFEPQVVAALLNSLTADDINRFKAAALAARWSLNADVEMQKLLAIYADISKEQT